MAIEKVIKLDLYLYITSTIYKQNGACRLKLHAPIYLYIALLLLAQAQDYGESLKGLHKLLLECSNLLCIKS